MKTFSKKASWFAILFVCIGSFVSGFATSFASPTNSPSAESVDSCMISDDNGINQETSDSASVVLQEVIQE